MNIDTHELERQAVSEAYTFPETINGYGRLRSEDGQNYIRVNYNRKTDMFSVWSNEILIERYHRELLSFSDCMDEGHH